MQLAAWIRSKITAICQVADTHVIRPMKIRKLQKDIILRRELMKLSQLENTAIVFKCGMYEIMRSLFQVVKELKEEWKADQYLYIAGCRISGLQSCRIAVIVSLSIYTHIAGLQDVV